MQQTNESLVDSPRLIEVPGRKRFLGTPSPATALLLVLVLALCVRLFGLGTQDYWIDEIHTLVDSAGRRAEFESIEHGVIHLSPPRFTGLIEGSTFAQMWRGMEADSHPPLYFAFFRGWRLLVGDGEFSARLPSAIFSAMSILMVALMAGAYGRLREGVWIALGLALSYSHVHMAQQARPYALALLLVSLSYWSLIKMGLPSPGRRLIWLSVYGVATYLAVMTHYFAGIAMLGQIAVVALGACVRRRSGEPSRDRKGADSCRKIGPLPYGRGSERIHLTHALRKDKRYARAWLLIVLVTVVAFAVTWGRSMLAQIDFIESHTWLLEHHPDHNWRTLLRAADLPVRLMFARDGFGCSYVLSLIGTILLASSGVVLWRSRCRLAIPFAAWYLGSVLAFVAIDVITQKQVLSHLRYVSVATPGLVGLLVLAALRLGSTARRVCLAVFAAAVLFTLRLPTQHNPPHRLAASLIAERVTPQTLLVYDAIGWPPLWASQIYYGIACYLPELLEGAHPPVVLLRDHPSTELANQIASYRRVIVTSLRADEIPNPAPGRLVPVDRTPYMEGLGFIYVFVELPDGNEGVWAPARWRAPNP